MSEVLFVLSAVCVINYLIIVVSMLLGNKVTIHIPILYSWEVSFANSWIHVPATVYQVWFWAHKFNVL